MMLSYNLIYIFYKIYLFWKSNLMLQTLQLGSFLKVSSVTNTTPLIVSWSMTFLAIYPFSSSAPKLKERECLWFGDFEWGDFELLGDFFWSRPVFYDEKNVDWFLIIFLNGEVSNEPYYRLGASPLFVPGSIYELIFSSTFSKISLRSGTYFFSIYYLSI